MQNFHPDHPVTRQTYLMQRCRRQLQQRHLMSEVKWVEPALIPCECCQPSKGTHRKICWMALFGFCWVSWLEGKGENSDHFMATLWGESLKSDVVRVRRGVYWNIAVSFTMLCNIAWYRRLIADAKQQLSSVFPLQQEKYGNSRDALNTTNLVFSADTLWKHTDSSA